MLTAIIVGILGLAGIAALSKYQSGKNRQKELKMAQDAALALEAQRFEKLREILTDGVIDGNPAAVEVLKPIAGVIAEQLGGEKEMARKKLEHQHRLEEIEARNKPSILAIEASLEPLKWWERQIKLADKSTGTCDSFRDMLNVIQINTRDIFPNLQLPEPPSQKLLAQTDEKDDE